MHGGVVSDAADNALANAGGSARGMPVMTFESKIKYDQLVIGEWLIARAQAVYCKSSQAICCGGVFAVVNDEQKLCAVAQGTIARSSGEKTPQ